MLYLAWPNLDIVLTVGLLIWQVPADLLTEAKAIAKAAQEEDMDAD